MSPFGRRSLSVAVIVLGVAIGWLYYSPYVAIAPLQKAARAGDADAVSAYVDFPTLRESLKSNFNASMMKSMRHEMHDNPFAMLGVAMANLLIERLVDAMVSPQGIALMMEGRRVNPDRGADEPPPEGVPGSTRPRTEVERGYISVNCFRMTARNLEDGREFTLIFHRDWLSWKLAEVRLPL